MPNVHETKTNLSRLLGRVEKGEVITISRAGKPVARLVPITDQHFRVPGTLRGKIEISPDFDSYDAEIADLFEGNG